MMRILLQKGRMAEEGERSQQLAASEEVCEAWKVGTEVIDIEGGVNEGEEEIGGWWWITQ